VAGRNITRWRNEEVDKLYKAAEGELGPVKRAGMYIKMNDLAIQNVVVIRWYGGRACARSRASCGWSRAAGTPTSGTCRTGTARA